MRQKEGLTHFLSPFGAKTPPFQREIVVPLRQVSNCNHLKTTNQNKQCKTNSLEWCCSC